MSSFDRSTTILDYGPRPVGRIQASQWILWPAWCYRVVAPAAPDDDLNAFQRLVLDICSTGCIEANAIAKVLPLDAQLIAHITGQLQVQSYLDESGFPTPKGFALLQGDELDAWQRRVLDLCSSGCRTAKEMASVLLLEEEFIEHIAVYLQTESYLDISRSPTSKGVAVLEGESVVANDRPLITGFVFQDPWTHELWPCFADKLMYADVSTEGDRPRLVVRIHDDRRPVQTWTVFPNDAGDPSRPQARKVLDAAARHRALIRAARAGDEQPDWEQVTPAPEDVSRVTHLGEKPEPVYLATLAYISGDDSLDWHTCDPFGLDDEDRMRKSLARRIGADPSLARTFDKLLAKTGFYEGVDDYREYQEELRHRCEAAVRARLTADVVDHPAYETLVSVESFVQQAETLGDKCPPYIAGSAYTWIRTSLEQTLSHLATRHTLTNVWKLAYVQFDARNDRWKPMQDRRDLREVYKAAARSFGVDGLPDQLLSVKASHLKSFSYADAGYRLNPSLLATVLAASEQPEHPLRSAVSSDPEIIVEMVRLGSAGGAAVHDFQAETEGLRDDAESLYRIVGLLTGLPYERD